MVCLVNSTDQSNSTKNIEGAQESKMESFRVRHQRVFCFSTVPDARYNERTFASSCVQIKVTTAQVLKS